MIKFPSGLWLRYDEQLDGADVPLGEKADYRKRLRCYLDLQVRACLCGTGEPAAVP